MEHFSGKQFQGDIPRSEKRYNSNPSNKSVICQAARAHHTACADIYHAFNGAHGTQFDGPYVAADHVHPSLAGEQLIAQVLQNLGYAPLR